MALRLGMNGRLYRNTGTHAVPVWVEIGNVRDVTLNLETGESDVTTRQNNGFRATVGTLKEASVEFEMVWDTGDANFLAIHTAFFGNSSLEVAVMDGDIAQSGSQGLRATVSVINFSRKEPLEEAMTVDVSLKPTFAANAPAWMTIP